MCVVVESSTGSSQLAKKPFRKIALSVMKPVRSAITEDTMMHDRKDLTQLTEVRKKEQ